jgi:hypothetical protein
MLRQKCDMQEDMIAAQENLVGSRTSRRISTSRGGWP